MTNESPIYPPPLNSEDMSTAAGIKAYTRRVIDAGESPTHLPENPWLYFNQTQSAKLVNTDLLMTERVTAAEDIDKSKKRFLAASYNIIPKRNPISVSALPGGMYAVIDGSSTLNTFKALDWSEIAVEIIHPHDEQKP